MAPAWRRRTSAAAWGRTRRGGGFERRQRDLGAAAGEEASGGGSVVNVSGGSVVDVGDDIEVGGARVGRQTSESKGLRALGGERARVRASDE